MKLAIASLLLLAACTPKPSSSDAASDGGSCWAPVGVVIDSLAPSVVATAFVPDSGAALCLDANAQYRIVDARTGVAHDLVSRDGNLETTQRHNGAFGIEVRHGETWRGLGTVYFVRQDVGALIPTACHSFEQLSGGFACDDRLYNTDGGLHSLQADSWLGGPGGNAYALRGGDLIFYPSLSDSPRIVLNGLYDLQFWAADEGGVTTLARLGDFNTTLVDGGVFRDRIEPQGGFSSLIRVEGRAFVSRSSRQNGTSELCEVPGLCQPGLLIGNEGSEGWVPSLIGDDRSSTFVSVSWDGGWAPTRSLTVPSDWRVGRNRSKATSHRPTFVVPGQQQVVVWLGKPAPEDDLVSVKTPFVVSAAGFRGRTLWASGADAGTLIVSVP